MFGKAPADEDTAAIARARLAMDVIDRDEREPNSSDASSTKSRGPSSKRSNSGERGSSSDQSDNGLPAAAGTTLSEQRTTIDTDRVPVCGAPTMPISSPLPHEDVRPASENEVLDLFDEFGKNADIDDGLLSLDDVVDDDPHRGIDDCNLDVSFDALDVTGVDPVDLTQSAHMSETDGDPLALDVAQPAPALARSPLSNCPEDDLFYTGRTGLTPRGPMQKTPAGMVAGLLSPHDLSGASVGFQPFASEETSSVSSSILPSQADDLTIDLPAVETAEGPRLGAQNFPPDRAARIAHCEFISPNVQEYHAAWGLPAPEVKIPSKVSEMLNTSKQPLQRNMSAVSDDTVCTDARAHRRARL